MSRRERWRAGLSQIAYRISGQMTKRRLWWYCIFTLTAFRLILCAKDEIVPMQADSTNYARLAVSYFTGDAQDVLPSQRPGIGMLAQVATSIGIPFKLGLDLALIATAYCVARVISRSTRSSALGILGYAFIVLNLWFIASSQTFLSEPTASIFLLLLWICSVPLIWFPPQHWTLRRVLPAAACSAAYVLIRPENAIVYMYWVLVALVAWVFHRRRFAELPKLNRWLCVALALLPAGSAWIATTAWKFVHRAHYGVSTMSKSEAGGEMALLDALYSIHPNQEIRYAPVTLQSLEAACRESPTMNQYRQQLLDPNEVFFKSAKQNLGLEGEVGTWLNWHLVRCFGGTDASRDQEMRTAASEIRGALNSGRLPRRWAKYPIDPLWTQWTRDLPRQASIALYTSFLPGGLMPRTSIRPQEQGVNAFDRGMFDDGLLRRRGTRNEPEIRIWGQCFDRAMKFARVRVQTLEKVQLGTARIMAAGESGKQFEVTAPAGKLKRNDSLQLEFISDDPSIGPQRAVISINSRWQSVTLSAHSQDEIEGRNSPSWTILASITNSKWEWRVRWQRELAKHNRLVLGILAVASLGLGLVIGSTRRHWYRWLPLIVVGLGLLLGRSMFYALLEVWLNWGVERYVGPNHLLAGSILILSAYALGACVARIIKPRLWRPRTNPV